MRFWSKRTSRPAGFPSLVTVEEMAETLAETPASVLVMGATRTGAPVLVDLDVEPHMLLHGPAGAGKTAVVRSVAAQMLAHGAEVVVLDVKQTSHRWALSHPDVRYPQGVAQIHAELLRLAAEMDARMAAGPEKARRLVVVAEERGALLELLQMWWAKTRHPHDVLRSPALDAMERLEVSNGLRVHVVSTVQMLDGWRLDSVTRDAYGWLVVAGRTSPQAWAAATGGLPFPGRAAMERRGRFWVVGPGAPGMRLRVAAMQALFVTEADAVFGLVAAVVGRRREGAA